MNKQRKLLLEKPVVLPLMDMHGTAVLIKP